MKKNLFIILIAALALTSCKTREKIIYLQDLAPQETTTTPAHATLKLTPGDKIGVTITSAATPEYTKQHTKPRRTKLSLCYFG